ncbi:unnamed protein product [Ilex paraguariensis]|uniref:Uncharacterized protein n=1 Tax=Ilex paraguariensis TaxID=185542 RepID=A0ABC8TCY8_9AQUA
MLNKYVLVNYVPDTIDDKVLFGPLLIGARYPSLRGTAFAERGIDCAFGSHHKDQAFIFSENLCAQINYAPHIANNKIIKGPTTIATMFPFFTKKVFESGVDAAFESTKKYEAYLFKGDQRALINYDYDSHLIAIYLINQWLS